MVFYKSILLYDKKQDNLPHTHWKQCLIIVYCLYDFRCLDIVETTVMSAWHVTNVIKKPPV